MLAAGCGGGAPPGFEDGGLDAVPGPDTPVRDDAPGLPEVPPPWDQSPGQDTGPGLDVDVLPDIDALLDITADLAADAAPDVDPFFDASGDLEPDVEPPDPDGACVGVNPAPWSRSITGVGGTVVFTELMIQPAGDPAGTWIEVYNPLSIDMDLSGWRIDGVAGFTFPDGTMLPPRGHRVVASDPAALAPMGVPDALGPLTGGFPSGGGTLELRSNSHRLMDLVAWSTDAPWPVTAFGSGASLSKHVPQGLSERGEAWRGSAAPGGTPGAPNFPDPLAPPLWSAVVPDEATWTYDVSGASPPADWAGIAFDDTAWGAGTAPLFAGVEAAATEVVTARVTADNFFALYTGTADGDELTLIGRDGIGDWTSAEDFSFDADPDDHLYVAAWEAPGAAGGPQMLIGEVETPDGTVGTDADGFRWILGPPGASPGGSLADPPPSVQALLERIGEANAAGTWAPPAVEADKGSGPWGGALAGVFTVAQYIWSDTFSAVSESNDAETYVLFRTAAPLLPPPGETEIPLAPVTTRFRHTFLLPGDPTGVTLWLEALVDDGAVFYLNGVEVLRLNMPEGPVGPSTFAAQPVDDPVVSAGHQLPADLLVPGLNVLAAEVHQAAPGGGEMVFAAGLMAQTWPSASDPGDPGLRFSEVSAGGAAFWMELVNTGDAPVDTGGMVVATAAGLEAVLPGFWIEPGELALFGSGLTGFAAEAGDRLFLYGAGKSRVLDGVRVTADPRARGPGGGPWFFPGLPSPGEENPPQQAPPVVINEVMYHHATADGADGAVTDVPEEWVELYNAGSEAVDLGGWSLVDGIRFQFPAATLLPPGGFLVVARDALTLAAVHPAVAAVIIGDFQGKLSNGGERIVLRDACGNMVDAVRYADAGRWPRWADGGGSSLELRDPRADNAIPEAWGASLEAAAADWEVFTIEGVAAPSAVGPDGVWDELVFGLLDDGVVLLDDVSLIEDPGGAALERIQDGTFDSGVPAGWRLLGNHRHSAVVADPADPGNPVLRLVSTGSADHMHNHAETTLEGGASITNGVAWQLSFRARWEAGSNQLHSRLYFNRLPMTTRIPRSGLNGTPGAPNSVLESALGPTFDGFSHRPAVPAPGEPVIVSVAATDPDGVGDMTLWYAQDGGPAQPLPMSAVGERYAAQLPGAADGTIVQFWVTGTDALGGVSTFPPQGADSRALYAVDGGGGNAAGLNSLRIIVTPADDEWLFTPENLMSNDRLGATVIRDEREAFYDVGLRLKGSERGRPTQARVGFSLRFAPDAPLHGVHRTVMVDRSEGVGFGQREMLVNLMMARAGAVSAEYSDLIHVEAPRDAHTGAAELQLTRFEDLMLETQFAAGSEGRLYEYEYIYYPTTTTDGDPESPKLPQPDKVQGTGIQSLGDGKEAYRYIFLPKNNRRQDDFDDLIAFAQFFGDDGPGFEALVGEYIDVDQWLRAFALATLPGAIDHYAGGSGHNAIFYVRPEDGRVLYFPHDLDFFPGTVTKAVVGHPDLERLLASPPRARIYYGHLHDIIQTAYNSEYMGHWCEQLGGLLPNQDFQGHLDFINARAAWVLDGSPESILQAIPPVPFGILTGGGSLVVTSAAAISLEGQGWVDVVTLHQEGEGAALPVTWTDETHWTTTLPIDCGSSVIILQARDHHGKGVGTDAVQVVREGAGCL